MKDAARRRIDRTGHLARGRAEVACRLDAGVRDRHRGQQSPSVRMQRIVEELVDSIRPLVTTPGQPLHVEFEERATGKLARLDLDEEPADEADVRALLSGRRLLLIEKSPTRADRILPSPTSSAAATPTMA